jgi:redox-sensitive bicupin YhaK (pirin superfamily)
VTATNGDYNTSQVTELTNLYYTEARVNANANVAANTAARHNAVTLGVTNGLGLVGQQLSLGLASSSANGALSSTDWTTFNSKENAITAGTTAQYFRGDKTFQTLNTGVVPESGNLYFTNARAIASVLTGYTSGAGTISAADSILSAIQKLNGNISALVTGVSSVNGQTGAVTLTTTNIAEGTNLYYTEARVNANTNVAANTAARHAAVTLGITNGLGLTGQQLSLGLASAGVTGALSGTDWSTFNSKQQALNGTGFVKISGTTISYDNSTYLTTASAASTYLPLAGGTLTGALGGTSATFTSSVTATSFFESSDSTIKTLVENNYQAKGIDSVVAKLYIKNGKQELGYYAQDLEGVLPSAVNKGEDGLLNLSYREVHTAKIAYLEQKIKQLENELGKLS